MKLLWTENAIQQLQALYDYIAKTSPKYADRVIDRILSRSEQMVELPRSGRMVPEYEIDEMRQFIEGSYRIIYWIAEEQIDVLAIVHTAREGLKF